MIPLSETIPSFLKSSGVNMVAAFTGEGILLDSNRLFDQVLRDEKAFSNFYNCFPADVAREIKRAVKGFMDRPTAYVFEATLAGRRYKWEIMSSGTHPDLVFFAIGQCVSGVSIHETVTIRSSENWYETFFNNSPAIAWMTDEKGRMILMNHMFREVVGIDEDENNKTIWELFPEEFAEIYHQNNMEVLATNSILKTEEVSIDKEGRTRNFLVYKFPVNSSYSRKLVGGWSIDITDKKDAESKVIKHTTQLKEIAFMQSHEVRRPLANILSIVDLIKSEEPETTRFAEFLDLLYLSATELDEAIKKIMRKTSTH